ncbi:MAG: IS21 family transposase [Elusimicrobiota bacterium]
MAVRLEDRAMIRYLREKGYSIRRISRELGISRRAIRKYLQDSTRPKYVRELPYNSKLELYKAYIKERLNDYPDITALKLFNEIKDEGFSGSYRLVAYYVSRIRPVKSQKVFLRYETEPGDEAQVDWSEFGSINYYGRNCKLYCFSFVWGYSRRHYIEFTISCDMPTLMRCHQRAFEYFGGVPKKILYDNMKTVVSENIDGRIRFNEKFLDFANYYGFMPSACDVGQAHQKGKIERVIEYIRTSFFCGEEFSELAELNAKALHWLTEIADVRIHGTTREKPIDRWQTEKNAILPLPRTNYDTRKVEPRLVQKDCYLNWEGNCYQIPWQYARQTVTVKADETTLQVYYDDKCIAQHTISKQKGKYIRNPEYSKGMPKVLDNRRQKYQQEMSAFGEVGLKYFEEILNSSISNPYHHLGKIIRLKESYPVSDIASSIEVALKFKSLQSNTVVNLVKKRIPAYNIDRLEKMLSIPGLNYNFQEVEERPLEFYEWVTGEKNG